MYQMQNYAHQNESKKNCRIDCDNPWMYSGAKAPEG